MNSASACFSGRLLASFVPRRLKKLHLYINMIAVHMNSVRFLAAAFAGHFPAFEHQPSSLRARAGQLADRGYSSLGKQSWEELRTLFTACAKPHGQG
jgi:hypothetical protein